MPYYTNFIRNDGFGAIFQNLIYDIVFTELNGGTFVYTPIPEIDHNYHNDPNYTLNLEKYMNIKEHYSSEGINNVEIIPYISTFIVVDQYIDKVFNSQPFHKYKEIFYKDKVSRFDPAFRNVAVHIRRFNVRDMRIAGTNTPDSYYLDIMNTIRKTYTDKPLKFHIHSQGLPISFKEFVADDVVLHINDSTLNSFNDLVFADILVTSKSSFSYIAAILSNGIIYYTNFWHPPLAHWIKV
jgi:hypothetical protein